MKHSLIGGNAAARPAHAARWWFDLCTWVRRARHTLAAACMAGLLLPARSPVAAQQQGAEKPEARAGAGRINLAVPTWGGMQVWLDELVLHDWRIQRNMLTGHYRLLDGDDRRHAWGSFEECRARLTRLAAERHIEPMHGRVVVVLHGLFRTRSSMKKLVRYLRDEGKLQVVEVSCPTMLGSVADHAKSLDRVLRHLDQVERIDFVAHSLGNLIIRRWLAEVREQSPEGESPAEARVERIVMLAPPNQGAELAEKIIPVDLGQKKFGAVVNELAFSWDALEAKLATPRCEFGILAGGRGDDKGYNPLIAGDDDMVVAVASTRLAGARDFRLVPVWHTFMMNDERIQRYTLEFLSHGYFESEAERQPIEEREEAPAKR